MTMPSTSFSRSMMLCLSQVRGFHSANVSLKLAGRPSFVWGICKSISSSSTDGRIQKDRVHAFDQPSIHIQKQQQRQCWDNSASSKIPASSNFFYDRLVSKGLSAQQRNLLQQSLFSRRLEQQRRNHYTYSSPGSFQPLEGSSTTNLHRDNNNERNFMHRGYTIGIGGPVGSGKTALVLALTKWLKNTQGGGIGERLPPVGVVTNDIFTQEDAEFLMRNDALPHHLIRAVETGGCPHAAIREDVSANLTASEDLTSVLIKEQQQGTADERGNEEIYPPLILCESGGDNLAANFSRELADLTIYVIDVAGGDKVPRKGGPGITQSDLLIINKIDLAEQVGSDLSVMERDANMMRRVAIPMKHQGRIKKKHSNGGEEEECGPTVFASVKHGSGMQEIQQFILSNYFKATGQ